jgi:hypothetical protein
MAAHADQGGVELGVAAPFDYDAHKQTYVSFMRVAKYAVGIIAGILILMAIFLT